MSSWVRHHLNHLRRWKEYAEIVAKAARDILGDVKVYVIGGVAEGRTTIYSDIDVLIVVRNERVNRKRLCVEMLERAIDVYGLLWDAPVELHIVGEKEAEEYLKMGRHVEIYSG